MKILLLSPYDAMSHRLWRESTVSMIPDADWTVLTLPPRHFTWRIRGNGLTWALGEADAVNGAYDLVIATSMTDLSTLRGLAPNLARIPTILYFHENQFTYPRTKRAHPSIDPLVVQLYAAVAADTVAFNSEHNRTTFAGGVRTLLKRLPDGVPAGINELLEEKMCVLPVPIADEWFSITNERQDDVPLTILWNHRWEYDKGPDGLLEGLLKLEERGTDFRVHVLGQGFRSKPAAFSRLKKRLAHRLESFGFIEDADAYRRIVASSDIVLSTAYHDFQGLSVLESTAAGCIPAVPDRLAYPDFIPAEFRYPSIMDDDDAQAEAIADHLFTRANEKRSRTLPAPPRIDRLSRNTLESAYRTIIEHTAHRLTRSGRSR